MKIRNAIPDDLVDLMPMLEKIHSESLFSGQEIDKSTVLRTFVTMIYFERGYAKVVENKGSLVGALVGVMAPNYLGVMMAQDIFTFSSVGTHVLVKDFKKWAKDKGCFGVHISDFSGIKRYHSLLERVGLKNAGVNFIEVF